MTAIWPAGPPKVCSEMANQVLVASDSGMTSRPLAALGGSGSGVMPRVSGTATTRMGPA